MNRFESFFFFCKTDLNLPVADRTVSSIFCSIFWDFLSSAMVHVLHIILFFLSVKKIKDCCTVPWILQLLINKTQSFYQVSLHFYWRNVSFGESWDDNVSFHAYLVTAACGNRLKTNKPDGDLWMHKWNTVLEKPWSFEEKCAKGSNVSSYFC